MRVASGGQADATASPADGADTAGLFGVGVGDSASRILLAGQPRAGMPVAPGASLEIHHPKELLLALARAWLTAAGGAVTEGNPHFMPIAEWQAEMTVLHGAALDLACPVPVARNALFLDGEDMLALAEERLTGDPEGLRHRRFALMDHILSVMPEAAWGALPAGGGRVQPVPVGTMLHHAPGLRRGGPGAALARPVRSLACDFETGPYNFLALRRDRALGSSHVAVQFQAAARSGRGVLVSFATPGTLADLGPALRAFRALEEEGGKALLFVFFFGTPEEFAATLAARTQALFFGDNFRSPGIRFLFAPFEAAEVLDALRHATGSIDSAYAGVTEALARGLGLRHRLVLGPDGSFDLHQGGASAPPVRGIAWDALFAPATLARRRHAANRAGERALVAALAGMG
jgi:hypothetical protein